MATDEIPDTRENPLVDLFASLETEAQLEALRHVSDTREDSLDFSSRRRVNRVADVLEGETEFLSDHGRPDAAGRIEACAKELRKVADD